MGADTKKKADPKADADEEHDDEHEGDDHEQEHDDDERDGDEALVDEVVAKVLAALGARDGDGGDGDGGAGDGDGTPRTQRDEERDTYSAVRDAMDRLRREEATDTRIKKLEKRVQEVVREEAPRTFRRLTRIMWGAE